jgi:hypothetical protein
VLHVIGEGDQRQAPSGENGVYGDLWVLPGCELKVTRQVQREEKCAAFYGDLVAHNQKRRLSRVALL